MTKGNPYERPPKLSEIEANQQAELFFRSYYEDRGMLKWQGFFLSDHTAELKKQSKREAKVIKSLPQQSEAEIGEALQAAWNYHQHITIQINSLDQNQQPIECSGFVQGYQEDSVVFLTTNGEAKYLLLVEIKNIRKNTERSDNYGLR